MEKEKLIIRNFGPIKSVELDLGRFTILIGEQATGKSTVAKVLAVCRYFSYIIDEKINNLLGTNVNFKNSFFNGLESWGLKEYIKEDSYISYQCNDYDIVVEHPWYQNNVEFPVFLKETLTPKSFKFNNLLQELEKIIPAHSKSITDFSGVNWTIPTSFFLNDVKNVSDNPFYLPTQRGLQSIFDIGKNSIQNLSSALFVQLSKMDGIARHFTNETYIEPLYIYYKNVRGHGYIRKASETEYYSLYNAASGYQSIIPVVLVIKYYSEIKKRNKTFLIEEPEQNLFPSAQNKVMEYLVDMCNKYGHSILLTTQSPYIQTSLNNVMYAYRVGQINAERTSDIIDKKYWLNPEEVSAYRLLTDGTVKNILDGELMQIDAGEVDEISRSINDEWDKLANVEYNRVNES